MDAVLPRPHEAQQLCRLRALRVQRAQEDCRAAQAGVDTAAHCGFRFVIDGTPISSAQFGDRAVGCDRLDPAMTERWCPWSARQLLSLGAGAHTVKVQLTGDSASDALCSASDNEAFQTKLWVLTR